MSSLLDFFLILLVFLVIVGLFFGLRYLIRLSRGDPTIWERNIRKFEKQDRETPPPEGVIVFIGSSSIVYWKTLVEDMHPLPVLNRGFGGSRIPDVIHYIDRVVLPYQPCGVVFYAGENDITGLLFSEKKLAADIHDSFQVFCETIHATLASTPIFFISIKPPKRRKKFWLEMQEANKLIEEFCASDERLHYIDIVSPMLDSNGALKPDLFKWDGIHLNEKGYVIWASVVKPILMEMFPQNSGKS
jgi:lysophospholipase L1-like esterase